jgi:hypothetical protein
LTINEILPKKNLRSRLVYAFINIRVLLGTLACLGSVGLSQAQTAAKPPKISSCFYSGPIGGFIYHTIDPPIRLELEADGRGVKFIHMVPKNFDPNNPFKAVDLVEKATCRLKLDCTVPRDGLKIVKIVTEGARTTTDANVWTKVGSELRFEYSDEARDFSCHAIGDE